MESIVNTIDNSVIGNEILSLWTEYEERQTAESEIAYQLDKFEMIYQVPLCDHIFVLKCYLIYSKGRRIRTLAKCSFTRFF